jgi:AcrR family transcriptional regulator
MGKNNSVVIPPVASRRRSDGQRTHQAILETAMRVASVEGINGLTIGRLASELGVSKSGIFAHFRSRERLQLETLAAARVVFNREVIVPTLVVAPGLGRLTAMAQAFFSYVERGVFPGGCIFANMLAELDARSGPIRDEIAEDFGGWRALIQQWIQQAQQLGEIPTGADAAQVAFEIDAVLDYANYMYLLFNDTNQLDRGRAAVHRILANCSAS